MTNPENKLPENESGATSGEAENASLKQNENQVFESADSNVLDEHGDPEQLDELQHNVDYAQLSKEDLLAHLEPLVKAEDIDGARNRIRKIMEAFEVIHQDDKEKKLNEFTVAGGLPEDFHYKNDESSEKYFDLIRKYNRLRADHRKQQEKVQKDNLEEKKKIIEELKGLAANAANLKSAFEKLHELQTRWRAVGFVAKQFNDDLWQNYRYHIDRFYDLLKINNELRELDYKKNLEVKVELCERVEDLLLEPSINKAMTALYGLQEQWRSSGPVPREHSDTVWQRFKSASDKLFERRREHMSILDAKQAENLNAKIQLCEKIEKMIEEVPTTAKKWQDLFNQVEAVMEEWKKTGFASKKDNEKIWQRFRAARKSFFDKRDEFFENVRSVNSNNLKLKNDLCIQAEALIDSTDWKATTDIYKKLQEQWKTVGPTAYKHSEKVWKRFRTACDKFFENKKNHFAGMEGKQLENLKKKEDLVKIISEFQLGDDAAANIAAIKKFQSEWMTIEHVPIKEKERISAAYRKALDDLFSELRKRQPEGSEAISRLRVEHKSSSPHGQDELRGEKIRLQERISKLQKEVLQLENNIEFFGRSKNADKMKEEFLVKINSFKAEISQLKSSLKQLNVPLPN